MPRLRYDPLARIGAGSITASKLADMSVTSDKLGQSASTCIESLAEMRALDPALNVSYVLAGRSSRDDGGGGTFAYDPADTTSPDDGALTVVTSGGHRIKRVFSGPIDVRWFGAVADGNPSTGAGTDDLAALQSALDAAGDLGGGTVQCAHGRTHKVSAAIDVPAGVTLDATGSALLPTGDFHLVTITTVGARVIGGTYYGYGSVSVPSSSKCAVHLSGASDFVVSNISVPKRVQSGVDRGLDVAVLLQNCTHGKVDGVYYQGGNYQSGGDCVVFTGCKHIQVSRVTCHDLNKIGVYASFASGDLAPGAGGQEQNQAITISDVTVEGRTGAPYSCAVQVRALAGATISNIVARDTVYGVLSLQQYNTDGTCVIEDVVCANMTSRESTNYALFVDGTGLPGQARRLSFANIRIDSSATTAFPYQPGVVFNGISGITINGLTVTDTPNNAGIQLSSVTHAMVSNVYVDGSSREGLSITGCTGINVNGIVVVDSNVAGTGYNDIKVSGSTAVVINSFCCRSTGAPHAFIPLFIDNTNTNCFVGHGVCEGQDGELFADNRAVNTGNAPANALGYDNTDTPASPTPAGYVEAFVQGARVLIPYCTP